ncbi:dihydropteroate synthase [bacterium]|nr:dihydropteroate synthase [bacterium]
MKKFSVKTINNTNIEKELEIIGFDNSYKKVVKNKFEYLNIKIYDLTIPQANILKQTALSNGTDCAVNRNVLTNSVDKTDCILTGSAAQLKNIAKSLKIQPFGLKELSDKIENIILLKNKPSRTKLVGILNITENSFSDGGKYLDKEKAIEHLHQLINDGADIIDIGAESTKPYSEAVSSEIQLERLLPILNYINSNNITTPISIDTRNSEVAKECLMKGVSIINDVSGFDYDEKMVDIIKNSTSKIIIQHSKGTPETMQDNPEYENIIDEIYKALETKINFAQNNGIDKSRIIIDIGIGFGKKRKDNFELLRRVEDFKSLECEIMIGISRKSFLNLDDNLEKDIYSTALSALLVEKKVDYLRVHNVKMHKKLLELMEIYGE